MNKTYVIAEAGSNHNGDFENAKKLIDAAVRSGSDAVKFQLFKAEKLFSTKSKRVNNFNVFELFKPFEITKTFLTDVAKYSFDSGIEFMCTPFDEEAVDFIYNLGVRRMKVSGFESTDLRFIQYVASTKLPIIVSAGLGCDLEMIQKIIQVCNDVGCEDITILHCNSAYPTPQEQIKLDTISHIKSKFNVKVGLSDHTLSTLTPALAVMNGAECIEKHFTLSKSMPGPDHSFALEPDELIDMVKNIRLAESSKGIKNKFTDSEICGSIQGMRSVILKSKVTKGERVSIDNITTKRPFYEGNIPAGAFFDLLERNYEFKCDLDTDEFLTFENLKEIK